MAQLTESDKLLTKFEAENGSVPGSDHPMPSLELSAWAQSENSRQMLRRGNAAKASNASTMRRLANSVGQRRFVSAGADASTRAPTPPKITTRTVGANSDGSLNPHGEWSRDQVLIDGQVLTTGPLRGGNSNLSMDPGLMDGVDIAVTLATAGLPKLAAALLREPVLLVAGLEGRGTATLFRNLASGDLIPTARLFPSSAIQQSRYSGRLYYVVKESGELVIGKTPHIGLSGGADVLAAGEAKFVNGALRWMDNASGHYRPTGEAAQRAAEAAFGRSGFDAIGKYIERVF